MAARAQRSLAFCLHVLELSETAAHAEMEKTRAPTIEEIQARAAREVEQALALEPNVENGLEIYRTCALCHMPEGWGLRNGSVPQLAGQHPQVVIKQLADIRAGNRDNPTMYAFVEEARLATPQAVADVAAYVATLETGIQIEKAPSDDPERGRVLYQDQCAECHGAAGEGDDDLFVPRLEGQHPAYLARQIQWIKQGGRHNADPEMRERVQKLSSRDIAMILGYVSQL